MSRFMNSVLTAIGIAIAGLVMASTVQAAPVSTAVLGNLNSPATTEFGSVSVGRGNSVAQLIALAQGFTTGSDAKFLELTKISLDLVPTQPFSTNSPVVQLWSSIGVGAAAKPNVVLASYVAPAIQPLGLSSGAAAAIYDFTGFQKLSANTDYWVVVRDANPLTGKFAWDFQADLNRPAELNASGFSYLAAARSLNDGTSWSRSTAIDGAVGAVSMELHAVPEPPTIILAGLGAVAFVANGYRRKKQRRAAGESLEQMADAGAIALTA